MKFIILAVIFISSSAFANPRLLKSDSKEGLLKNTSCPNFEKVIGEWYKNNSTEALQEMDKECRSWNGTLRSKSEIRVAQHNGYNLLMAICSLGKAQRNGRSELPSRSIHSATCPKFQRVVSYWYKSESASALEKMTSECVSWNGVIREKSFVDVDRYDGYTFAGAICDQY
jgi:hypothetical protein